MNNFPNNTPSNAPEEGKRIRAELKRSNSWVHQEEMNDQDKKDKLVKDIETEHQRVLAFYNRIKGIKKELETLTDKGEIAIREKLLNVLDYQKFVSVKKRYELAKGLSKEEKLDLEKKIGDVDLFNDPN